METLSVFAKQVESKWLIHWRTGHRFGGVIQMDRPSVRVRPEYQTIFAELFALNYLLLQRHVVSSNPKIRVGSDILSVYDEGMSDCLPSFATRFLRPRFSQCDITVDRSPDWLKVRTDIFEFEHPNLYFDSGSIDTDLLGRVFITKHALDQYILRHRDGILKNPWSSLAKRLKNKNLQLVSLPDKVLFHKKLRYTQATEFWSHPSSEMHYVLVPKGNEKSLVTVYRRPKDFSSSKSLFVQHTTNRDEPAVL